MHKLIAFVGVLVLAGAARGAQSPAQKCETAKNLQAGKLAACLQKAEARLLKTRGGCSVFNESICYDDEDCPVPQTCEKDPTRYNDAVDRCNAKFTASWQKLEQTASGKGAICPDGLQDGEVITAVADCVANVAGGLAGDGLTGGSGDLAQCTADLNTCTSDLGAAQTDLGTCTTGLGSCNGNLNSCAADLGTCTGSLGTCTTELGMAQTDLLTCDGNLTTCTNDLGTAQSALNTCSNDLTTCEGDLTVALECGNGAVDAGEDCDLGNLNSATCASEGFAGGVLRCGSGCVYDTSGCYAARYVDNTDGTITDTVTGLMWEKKVKRDSTTDLANLQDADNTYRWSGTCSLADVDCQPDGASEAACLAGVENGSVGCAQCGSFGVCNVASPYVTVWQWLAALNTASYTGHNDWRLAKVNELASLKVDDWVTTTQPLLVDNAFNGVSCGTGCTDVTDPVCSCTSYGSYWSASTEAPRTAWYVSLQDGFVYAGSKAYLYGQSVRAVRGGG